MDNKTRKIFSYILYVVTGIIVAASIVLIFPVYRKFQKRKFALDTLRRQLESKSKECIALNRQVSSLENSPEAIEKVAREKFGLCRAGEKIMRYDSAQISK